MADAEGDAFELHVSTLTGHTCAIQANRFWSLHDFQVAVQVSLGVPTDVQRLVAGTSILAGASKLLGELLPEDCADILCVRCQAWCIIPRYSGRADGKQEQTVKVNVDEAKKICEDTEDLTGFTLKTTDGDHKILKENGFALGTNNSGGFTYLQLTPCGRQSLLQTIQRLSGGRRRPLIESVTDMETVLLAVEADASVFKHVCHELKNNAQIVQMAIRANGLTLEYASAELRADRETVHAAILQNPFALQFASAELRADRVLVQLATEKEPASLRYAAEDLRGDPSICLAAVQNDGMMLKYASVELRNDRSLVLAAIHENADALNYASTELRSDKVMIVAAEVHGRAQLRLSALPPP